MKVKKESYSFSASVFLYPGETAAWHFVPVPKTVGLAIKATHAIGRPGFGMVRVRATIGDTTWNTSIFPDKHSGSYLLPLKALVRKREDIEANEVVVCTLELGI